MMPRFTLFIFALLVLSAVARAQQPERLSPALQLRLKEREANDTLTVTLSFSQPFTLPQDLHPLRIYAPARSVVLRLSAGALDSLLRNAPISFASIYTGPHEELNSGAYDLTLNQISFTHARYPQLNGSGLSASVKERLFDTADIDLQGRVFNAGLGASDVTEHASEMATIIAGAANSGPYAQGAAPAARVSSASFLNLFPDPDTTLKRYGIALQNHSYGTAVENFYGNEAAAYDAQVFRMSNMVHVFSSGNSGDQVPAAGLYNGLTAANLTGNFKQAKNIITAGSVDSAAGLMPLSSRGPAYDGRVKPELMAYGEDGSSGAAALVSGAALLVQDAYRRARNALPSASLVRAALLNSADDIGPAHVDYLSGYGNLNACRAVETMLQQRYWEDSVNNGSEQSFSLNLPAGIAQLKLMLTWTDPPAAAGISTALVNDLDLQLDLPATGESWKPWVLDPRPAFVGQPAVRQTDTLNNQEQVTIDQPAAGIYTVRVKGSRVAQKQGFSIAYQLDTAASFSWTFPAGDAHLLAGRAQWLRWQTNRSGPAIIEYATGAANWRTVANVDLAQRYYQWNIPDTVTMAVVRMRTASATLPVSDTFTISPQPLLQVGFNCTDSFLLYWNRIHDGGYRLYALTGAYLQSFAQVSDTAVFLDKPTHPAIYYAVAPLIGGREGIRGNTLNYTAQGTGCYVRSFFLDYAAGGAAYFKGELGSVYSVRQVRFEKLTGSGFAVIQSFASPSTTQFNFTDPLMSRGENRYRMAVVLANGTTLYSDTEIAYYLPDDPVIVYPNPVALGAALHIIAPEAGRYTVQILDASGRTVWKELLNSSLVQLNAARFARGLYLVRVIDNGKEVSVRKLVVK